MKVITNQSATCKRSLEDCDADQLVIKNSKVKEIYSLCFFFSAKGARQLNYIILSLRTFFKIEPGVSLFLI